MLVTGLAPLDSTIWLAQGTRPGYFTNVTTAMSTGTGTNGSYSFKIPVGYGSTVLQVFGENGGQDYSNVTLLNVTRGNAIVAWDSLALVAFQDEGTSAAETARDLAILHAAQYDSLAAFDFPNSAYQVHLPAPKRASAEAAVDSASYTVLNNLFPSLNPAFATAYQSAVAGLGHNSTVTAGLNFGIKVALQTFVNRASDGSNASAVDSPSGIPGLWRSTPPSFAPAVNPQFGRVTPFVISRGSEYRPARPRRLAPPPTTRRSTEVTSLGQSNSSSRTSDQTAAAQFWADGANTSPAQWNQIAEEISVKRKDSLVQDARLFARLDFAMADAGIASADAQYNYNEWRPVSAIQQFDPSWSPLQTTPASPGYVSDSAAYAGAASTVLTSGFGSKVPFPISVEGSTGPTRSFFTFAAAATEEANSRVWAGVNFSFDSQAGLTLGEKVGQAVLTGFPKGK